MTAVVYAVACTIYSPLMFIVKDAKAARGLPTNMGTHKQALFRGTWSGSLLVGVGGIDFEDDDTIWHAYLDVQPTVGT